MIRELKTRDLKIKGDSVVISGVTEPGMVLIWAGFCGHCTRFKPVYNELDKKIGKGFTMLALEDKQIGGAVMANAIGLQGYPTIKFVDQNGKIGTEYTGSRSMKDLLQHVCKHYHKCSN